MVTGHPSSLSLLTGKEDRTWESWRADDQNHPLLS